MRWASAPWSAFAFCRAAVALRGDRLIEALEGLSCSLQACRVLVRQDCSSAVELFNTATWRKEGFDTCSLQKDTHLPLSERHNAIQSGARNLLSQTTSSAAERKCLFHASTTGEHPLQPISAPGLASSRQGELALTRSSDRPSCDRQDARSVRCGARAGETLWPPNLTQLMYCPFHTAHEGGPPESPAPKSHTATRLSLSPSPLMF